MFRNRSRKTPRITVPNASDLDYRSAAVTDRLEKIADHYHRLEELLEQLEAKMPADPPAPTDANIESDRTVNKPR